MTNKWLVLKLLWIIYGKIFHYGIVSAAVIGMSVLVERRLRQVLPASQTDNHFWYTPKGIPPMNMIYVPRVLLESYYRQLLTTMSFSWL